MDGARPARPISYGLNMTQQTLGFSLLEAAFCSRPPTDCAGASDEFPILLKLAKAGALPDYPAAKFISPLLYAIRGTLDDWTRLQADSRIESARLVDPASMARENDENDAQPAAD